VSVVIKYYPEDSQRGHGTLGIKLPMNTLTPGGSSGLFNMSYTTEDQAVSNFVNLLLTKSGERYMQPDFGIGIQYYLFENNTDALRNTIKQVIQQQAAYWLPYIVIREIIIDTASEIPSLAADHEHGIHIKIFFSVTEVGANREIIIFRRAGATEVNIS
jgi:phage baseplate assembly protein W